MNRHSNRKQKAAWAALATAAALCLALAPAASAVDFAQVRAGSGGLDFLPQVENGGFVLTVSGPDGFYERLEFGAGESPAFSIFGKAGGVLADGSYNWELSVVPSDAQRRDALEANQTAAKSRGGIEALVQSGSFAIMAGSVVTGGEQEPGAGRSGRGGPSLAEKVQVINQDLVVQGSICVGLDCVSSESFGFDTIRLKENNTRIKFDDTSTTAGFPSVDWQLTANDSASGGANKFTIDDISNARTPFTIEANAPTNTLYVDSNKRIGIGTSTPAVEIHVKDGDSPTLRLEQDTSSGFAAQSYDIAANEANFFIRDNTTGSKLPFRLRPGAPTSSIDVAADGDVGIGTASPAAKLHVENTASNDTDDVVITSAGDIGLGTTAPVADLEIQRATNPGFRLQDNDGTGAATWDFSLNANGLFQISKTGTGGAEVLIRDRADAAGAETMDVDGSIEADNFNMSSSRGFKTGFQPVDTRATLARVLELPVSEWAFKWDASDTRHIGPMAEDFIELFRVGGDSTNISVGDASGVALAAIQGLHQVVQEKDARIQELEERLAVLEALLLQ